MRNFIMFQGLVKFRHFVSHETGLWSIWCKSQQQQQQQQQQQEQEEHSHSFCWITNRPLRKKTTKIQVDWYCRFWCHWFSTGFIHLKLMLKLDLIASKTPCWKSIWDPWRWYTSDVHWEQSESSELPKSYGTLKKKLISFKLQSTMPAPKRKIHENPLNQTFAFGCWLLAIFWGKVYSQVTIADIFQEILASQLTTSSPSCRLFQVILRLRHQDNYLFTRSRNDSAMLNRESWCLGSPCVFYQPSMRLAPPFWQPWLPSVSPRWCSWPPNVTAVIAVRWKMPS